ncbi:biotin-(acetyl-CoA-carboxylase) ligase [Cyanobium sp. PCC 7001]|uniref:biotin--[acetyl-CoA-carboxylase] ligase n=1 Tax=Cyanobium sp. PCC 7001 TaxID=180281 RepID=UPI0001805958|nr:biotin--[acetyl-CoA-carboxylase] ligase [Cyanobium sp. PCC 7001]EDY39823.1 biotin-(acetyl-CoA-carboxylase) ligase [Cyanobium sp. PCC 7001]
MAGDHNGALSGWRIRRLPVCGSTEWELERWLDGGLSASDPLEQRMAVVARRQCHGHGQRGRAWVSPPGGVWLSAAFPWPSLEAANLGLAVAVGVTRQLEDLGLPVQLKWPNDLVLHGRKLAGLLPRVRLRGCRVRWAQVGIGLNGLNRVPPGAVSVAQALARPGHGRSPRHPEATPRRLERRVWAALGWAQEHAAEPGLVLQQAEDRLWRPPQGLWIKDQPWQVAGLEPDGRLRLESGAKRTWLSRSF